MRQAIGTIEAGHKLALTGAVSGRSTVNLRHLEAVAAIRRRRSFGAAADEVALTQSALTQAVAGLERRLGRRLFDRGARGARPTRWGELLAECVDRTLALLNRVGGAVLAPAPRPVPLARRATATQLLALAAVERAGSIRGGARAAGLTEASVHRAVRDLEASLGAELLARTAGGVRATAAAAAIARATRQAFAELDRAFAAIRAGGGQRLALGALPPVRGGLLPSAMARFAVEHPDAAFSVVEGTYRDLLAALLDGTIDLLLAALRDHAPEGTVQQLVVEDDLVVAARADHPLVRADDWDIPALGGHPWAASPPGTPRRASWEALFRDRGLAPPAPRVECSSAAVVRGLLLQGDWLAMLSPDQFRLEREVGLLAALRGPVPAATRRIGVLLRAGWLPDAWQSAFLDMLQRCARP